jgi:Protein of unknown function (DUF4054)
VSIQVSFDFPSWQAQYAEFNALSEAQATNCFNLATAIHDNSGVGGPVSSIPLQTTYLNLLTCHFAQLLIQAQGSPSPGSAQDPNSPVGRISDAAEGSVSVHLDMPNQPQSAAFFQQTKYGTMYYAMTAVYRTMRYRVGPRRIFNYPYGAGGGYGGPGPWC